MALGVTDHIWTIAELVKAALEPSHTTVAIFYTKIDA
jgi:hypothetical protein